MTQENVNVELPISMEDIRKVLNQDAKFALQVQNAALNRAVAELSSRLDASHIELATIKEQLDKAQGGNKKGG